MLMNETQPPPPEDNAAADKEDPQVGYRKMIHDIADAVAALQAGQSRILEILGEPARLAEQQKQQGEAAADAWGQSLRNYAQGGDPE